MIVQARTLIKHLSTLTAKSPVSRSASVVAAEEFDKPVCFKNEPILEYMPGSTELAKLEAALKAVEMNCEEIPIVINGKELTSDSLRYQVMPHKHCHKIAKYYYADESTIHKAISAAVKAQIKWDSTKLSLRTDIWQRAADLMAGTYRAQLLAATMMGQAKTVYQAEIDAGAELVDFMRCAASSLKQASEYEPISNSNNVKNYSRLRGIDGFVAAITPFNFTAIAGNLAYTPAVMGNAVVWKPSDNAILSNWIVFKIMREAGVPDGVVNFVPADGPTFGRVITNVRHLAAINFTGSELTFKALWRMVNTNLDKYNNFPRMVGECGGKNFHFVHSTANVNAVVAGTIRAAFEYSGQKCSACSCLYVPKSLWEKKLKALLLEKTNKLIIGDVCDYKSFLSAVIDAKAFKRITNYIEVALTHKNCTVIAGGHFNNLKGYFIDPTIVEVSEMPNVLLREEIFGPVLTVYAYKDEEIEKTMDAVAIGSKYGLTASIYGTDETFLKKALEKFKMCAGNFYINDKCTGAVVGQQPFGGGRMSGTNDKAGGPQYVLRWTSQQIIKESFSNLTKIYYPYMGICE